MENIVLSGVAKEYPLAGGGSLKVLNDISCELRRGTFNSILGPSGCGKSTLLGLIAGLDSPTSGKIDVGPTRPRVGFVFQQPRLLNWRTLEANVLLPLEQNTMTPDERRSRARHYLRLVGLAGYENYYPLQVSGGMQQRASIARALVIDPDVLLMDEPFSGLDEWTARKLREEIVGIWQETKKTVVFVTHSIAEAVFLSQQVLVVTPKPATILQRVSVDFPHLRRYDDLRLFELQTQLTKDCLANWGGSEV